MKCENCSKVYDEETEGVTTNNKYTGEEHNFCTDYCLHEWSREAK